MGDQGYHSARTIGVIATICYGAYRDKYRVILSQIDMIDSFALGKLMLRKRQQTAS